MHRLDAIDGPIYPVSIVGLGRTGKSTTLNAMVACLARWNLLQLPAASCQAVCRFFETNSSLATCTLASNVLILRLAGQTGAILFYDFEGLGNNDHDSLTILLGLSSQVAQRLCFMDHKVNDHFK